MSKVTFVTLKRWQIVSLIGLLLPFAACASSILVYRALGWAPEVIDFAWVSYRSLNIYVSLLIIGYLVWGLLRRDDIILYLLPAFSLFHLAEGVAIGFWAKAGIHLLILVLLAWIARPRILRKEPQA